MFGVISRRLPAAMWLTLLCFALALWRSDGCKKGAAEGIALCLRVLAPSLFPFMALSGLAAKTGLCHAVGRRLQKPTRCLFGLDGALAPVILLSLLGGYPVGARAVADLWKSGQLDEEQARHAAYFCVCAGPGFVVSYVGGLCGSSIIGAVMFAAQVLSVLLTGIGMKFLYHKHPDSVAQKKTAALPFSDALVEAAADASRGMVGICGMVVLFSAFVGMLTELIPSAVFGDAVVAALEVSTAVSRLKAYPIELTAFAVGWGGVCVHFQIFSALGGLRLNRLLFFSIRILQGVLTALLTHLGLRLFVRETAVFSTAAVGQADFTGGSIASGAALMIVAVCFLFTLKTTDWRH